MAITYSELADTEIHELFSPLKATAVHRIEYILWDGRLRDSSRYYPFERAGFLKLSKLLGCDAKFTLLRGCEN